MAATLPQEVLEAIGTLKAALKERFGARLREIRLFGSYARGEARPDSDVDLLVLIDDLTWRESIEAIDLGTDVELGTGVCLAPLPRATRDFERLRAIESGFARDIERDGVVV